MKKVVLIVVLGTVLAACGVASRTPQRAAAAGDTTPVFCADGSSALCSQIPVQIQITPGYSTATMQPTVQDNFDNASWQTFIALNWPANPDGTANTALTLAAPLDVPRVWDYYKDVNEVFLPLGAVPNGNYPSTEFPPLPPQCQTSAALGNHRRVIRSLAKIDDVANIPDSLEEAAVNVPLIDSNGNFVVYSISLNEVAFEYIYQQKLYTADEQDNQTVVFPYSSPDSEGAIVVKAAWKVLTQEDNPYIYITRPMQIFVPAEHSQTGEAFCTETLQMGLIGMHIAHKVSGNARWVWSTFEHVKNAPLSSTPVPATINANSPPCEVPLNLEKMSLYNPLCVDSTTRQRCGANVPPVPLDGKYLWQTTQPYAKAHLISGLFGTQVVRCASIYDGNANNGTASLNVAWQGLLKAIPSRPYSYYQLVGTQWFAPADAPPAAGTRRPASRPPATAVGPGVANGGQVLEPDQTPPAPPLLQNVAAETYLQNGTTLPLGVGSCIGCHLTARDAAGQPSDLSFMLNRAQSPVANPEIERRRRAVKQLLDAAR